MAITDFSGAIQNIVVFPSAAQTATVVSPNFTNSAYKGMVVYFNITAFSGTSLQLQLGYTDPVTGVTAWQNVGSARTATGMSTGLIYPCASLVTLGLTPLISMLPANWSLKVVHTAATATYSITVDLVP